MAPEMATYTRADLISDVAGDLSISKAQVDSVVRATFDRIANTVRSGRRVELRGFAVFKRKTTEAHSCRNPNTGKIIDVPRKHHALCKVKFRLDDESE